MEATASNVNNRKLKALLAAGTAGAAMMGVGLMGTTAHADTLIDANHVQVDAGDTLSTIAKNHNTTVDQLAKDNNISDINMIHVGDKLVITPNGQSDNNASSNDASAQSQQATAQNTSVNTGAVQAATTGTGAVNNGGGNYSSNLSGNEAAAKAWIAQRESGGNYNAQNGRYTGKFQLDSAYLNGDYSPANQERVADQYVAQRYGSWTAAQAHWAANGWY